MQGLEQCMIIMGFSHVLKLKKNNRHGGDMVARWWRGGGDMKAINTLIISQLRYNYRLTTTSLCNIYNATTHQ